MDCFALISAFNIHGAHTQKSGDRMSPVNEDEARHRLGSDRLEAQGTDTSRPGTDEVRPVVHRACDQCNFRKVKCRISDDGSGRCLSCISMNLRCERNKAARRRGPRASRVEALQRQQQDARQQGPEGSGTAGPSGSHVLGGGSPDRGQHPVQIGGFLSSLGAHGLSSAPVQGSHQHQQHQQHSHHPQAPSGHEPQQQPNQLSPFGSASLQQPIAPSHTAGALPAPNIPGPIPGQQDWSTWAGFPDSTVSQSDSRTLPFIDWARDSALDFAGALGDWVPDGSLNISLPAAAASPPTITSDDVHRKLDAYFEYFYPMFPILSESRVRAQVPAYITSCMEAGMQSYGANSGGGGGSAATRADPDPANKLIDSILAIIESRDQPAGKAMAPRLARMSAQAMNIVELSNPCVDLTMVNLHIFVALQSLGERLAAWFYMQQAMTQVLMLGAPDWESTSGDEHLRLYWILYIAERAYVALQQLPVKVNRPLRLGDDAYAWATQHGSPFRGLSDFPMSHLRLFSLIKAPHVTCWRGLCEAGRGCTAWTVDMALRTMMCFREEMAEARKAWATRKGLAVQTANLVITIAWFRDRFWNMFLRHDLIGSSNHPALGFASIDDNLTEVTEFCMQIKITDFDRGVDCNAKLLDLAMTALTLVKLVNANTTESATSIQSYPELPALASRLLASVYKILGLLNMLGSENDTFCRDLRRALAEAT